jgi:hypothetical protein
MDIPSREDWGEVEQDLDTEYAFKTFFGKTIVEAVPLIKGNPIERADEIRFMPPVPFRYYILAYRDYLLSEDSIGDPDAASCYIRLIAEKISGEPHTIGPVLPSLIESVQKVVQNQSFYDADEEIYGDFRQMSEVIFAAHGKIA